MHDQLTERDYLVEKLKSSQSPSEDTSIKVDETKDERFEQFLDLRKKLRRSIFRGEEYSHDADVILSEIEQFKGVTFELVKVNIIKDFEWWLIYGRKQIWAN